jgi:hypothetical protein
MIPSTALSSTQRREKRWHIRRSADPLRLPVDSMTLNSAAANLSGAEYKASFPKSAVQLQEDEGLVSVPLDYHREDRRRAGECRPFLHPTTRSR